MRVFGLLFILLFVVMTNSQSGYYQAPNQNYYRPPQQQQVANRPNNLIYAKVYPLTNDGHQSGRPFTAYLLPLQGNYQGYYQVLCSREASNENVEVLSAKLKQLNEMIQTLTNNYNQLSKKKSKTIQTSTTKSSKDSAESFGVFPSFPSIQQPNTNSMIQQISTNTNEPAIVQQISNNKNSVQQIGNNLNTATTNVMQCEGVTCPKETSQCKIVEKSDEPNHETITTTIFCMGANDKVLKEDKSTKPNPQKGSSLSNTRTIGGSQNSAVFQQMQDEMDQKFGAGQKQHSQTMDDMQQNMKSIFGSGFFANNPFVAK